MNRLIKILILTLILASCKKETEQKAELGKSEFNLKTDLTDFKNKMAELDTLKIWFNHSVCTYQGAERIEITKESDSIKIHTEFKEDTFEENPEWKVVYKKKIPITDTIWKIEEFFKRNIERQKSEEKEYGTLQISLNNKNRVHYFTNGLNDLNRFMKDYFETMKMLHPENIDNIYGVEIENINKGKIKETELESE
ncbi:hypothetical protein [Tenacibaculum finnmarkense]|uniref:hypothetical protein n=1 Tax=Tenacibaculum finnmarkense TaxID=2781243 RepID=UPI001EFB929C|nr:hypothetical protein [Tenacibaculum finnmarkense]MCG8734788.1 hypothetical protein [Tenacibaculum finnmarkense]MCG8831509.1 hypothetical protein [Tenacibaculum finnmarkense]WCC41475.1 hypothetical protein PJJ26_08225 [Tenacibaculum finnmarkense]